MAIITIPGRAGIARSIRSNQLFIAWGTGNPEWTNSEKVTEDSTQTSLFREIGRRVVDETYFVVGDDQGDLVTPSGRWRISENPTNQLYVKAQFDYADGNGYTIREYGLFLNTVVQSDLPIGQRYFLPAEIEDFGELLMLENCVPLIRTGNTRHSCSFVVTF